ncbi:MarR family transcriptional regulator [Kribbella sp. NPDC023855]|uniref:MarR family winged helix-turn-helix transcriptional regulator n=1 Tax=Kribbella sp. NPDC023855 TaxID=3154698 RepID=UPI003402F646
MTEWLNQQEQQDWRAFIEGSVRFIDLLDSELRRLHDLTLADYEILVRLSEADGRSMRMAELADLAYHSRSRLSHRIRRLEDRGLIRRDTTADDRRGVLAALTDEGAALLTRAARDNLKVVREGFVDVIDPADLRAVGRAFRAVTAQLDPS